MADAAEDFGAIEDTSEQTTQASTNPQANVPNEFGAVEEQEPEKQPDMSAERDYLDKNLQAYRASDEFKLRNPDQHPAKNYWEELKAGFQNSNLGLAWREKMPDTVDAPDSDMMMKIANNIGQVAGDLPSMVIGMGAGGAMGGGAGLVAGSEVPVLGNAIGAAAGGGIVAMAGAYALPQAIRKLYIDRMQRGGDITPEEFTHRLMGTTWEAVKGAATGTATAITGGAIGALPGMAAAPIAGKVAQLGGELITMTTFGKMLEGQLPTKEDYMNGALTLGALHGAGEALGGGLEHVAPKLQNIWALTGEHPIETVEAAAKDPVKLQELLSTDPNVPEQAKPKDLKHYTEIEGREKELDADGKEIPPPIDQHWQLTDKENDNQSQQNAEPPKPPEKASGGPPEREDFEKRILDTIVDREKPKSQPFTEKLKEGAQALDVALRNEAAPINNVVDDIEDNGKLDPSKNPKMLMSLYKDMPGKILKFLNNGTFDFENPSGKTGDGLNQILSKVPDRDFETLDGYLKSNRVIADPLKRDQGISVEDAQKFVDKHQEKFGPVAKELYDYQDRLAKYAIDSGILSKEKFDKFHGNYAPLFKQIEEDPLTGKVPGNKGLFQKMFGSDKNSISSVQGIFENTASVIKAAEKNRVLQAIVNLPDLEENGLMKEVPQTVRPIKVSADELRGLDFEDYKKEIRDQEPWASLDDIRKAYDGEESPALKDVTIYRKNFTAPADNEFDVKVNGEPQRYAFEPALAEAIKSMDYSPQFTSLWAKWFSAPFRLATKALRVGITGDPSFAVGHGYRVMVASEIQTKYPGIHSTGIINALGELFNHSDDYYKFIANGAGNVGMESLNHYLQGNGWGQDNMSIFYKSKEYVWPKNNDPWVKKAWNAITTPVRLAETMTQLLDNAPRYVEFKKGGGLTGDINAQTEAAYNAREVSVDYKKQGALIKNISFAQPFLNVDIQGTFKLIDSMKNPKVVAKALAIITLPEIVNFMLNKDDERYKNAPLWEHGAFMDVPINWWSKAKPEEALATLPYLRRQAEDGSWEVNKGPMVRILRSFGLGFVFGSLPHMLLDKYYGQNPRAFDNLGEQVTKSLLPLGPTTLIQPMLEQATNHSMFRGTPLVPDYLEKQLPQYQYEPYTSEVAKQVGKLIGYLPKFNIKGESPASPIVIDNYMHAWEGTLGAYVVNYLDKGLHAAGVGKEPSEVDKGWEQAPEVKRFFSNYMTTHAQSLEDFRNNFKDISDQANTLKSLGGRAMQGDESARADYMNESTKYDQAMHQYMAETNAAIKQQGLAISLIRKQDSYSAMDKRQQINAILGQMIQMAEQANKNYYKAGGK